MPENKIKTTRRAVVLHEPKTNWAGSAVFFVICAALLLTTLLYGTVHPPTVALFWASSGLLVVLWAADAFLSGFLKINKSWMQMALLAAGLFGIFQIIPFGSTGQIGGIGGIGQTISLDYYATLMAAVNFFVLLIYLSATLIYLDTPKRLKTLVYFLTIFGFLFAFFGIIQNLLDPNRIYGVYERPFVQPFGSFVNKHNFAAYIEMCIALPLGLLFSGAVGKDKRLLFITAIALMGIALVMSGSRGGLVALLAEIIFLVAIATKTRNARQLALKIGLATALVVAIISGTILIGGDSTLTRIAETAKSKDPTSSRLQIWDATLEVIKSSPVFGTGFGAFGVAYTKFDPMNGRERVEQAHNDYLQVLADAGIVGALIGLFFLFALFRDGWRRLGSKDTFRRGVAVGALGGCFAILVHSLFDFVLHTTAISLLFLVMAALATVNGRVESEENEDVSTRKRRKASVTPIESKRKQKEINEPSPTA